MRSIIIFILIFIFSSINVYAQEERVFRVEVEIFENGALRQASPVSIINDSFEYDGQERGKMSIVVRGDDQDIIFQQRINLIVQGERKRSESKPYKLDIFVPYFENANVIELSIDKQQKLVIPIWFQGDCNFDRICDRNETQEKCSADCSSFDILRVGSSSNPMAKSGRSTSAPNIASSIGYLAVGGALVGIYYFIRRFRESK